MKSFVRFFMTTAVSVTAFSGVALANNHEGVMHKVSGELRTRFEYRDNQNQTNNRYQEEFLQRARLNVDVMPLDTLSGRVALETRYNWGVNQTARPAVDINEAWMQWMASDMITLTVGRQMLSLGDERFIGDQDWQQQGQRHDMARVSFNYDLGVTHFFWNKVDERDNAGNGSDGNAFVLYNAFDLRDNTNLLNDFDLYGAYYVDNNGGDASRTKLFIAGFRLAGEQGMFDYGAEFIGQFGEFAGADSQKGYTADLDLGANFQERYRLGVYLTWANSEYTNIYGEQHPYLGQADVIRRNNVIALALQGDAELTDMIYAGVDLFYFMQANKDSGHTTLNTVATTTTDRALGMEADFRLGYTPEENLNFELGYAIFSPGDAFGNNDEVVHDFYLQGHLTF